MFTKVNNIFISLLLASLFTAPLRAQEQTTSPEAAVQAPEEQALEAEDSTSASVEPSKAGKVEIDPNWDPEKATEEQKNKKNYRERDLKRNVFSIGFVLPNARMSLYVPDNGSSALDPAFEQNTLGEDLLALMTNIGLSLYSARVGRFISHQFYMLSFRYRDNQIRDFMVNGEIPFMFGLGKGPFRLGLGFALRLQAGHYGPSPYYLRFWPTDADPSPGLGGSLSLGAMLRMGGGQEGHGMLLDIYFQVPAIGLEYFANSQKLTLSYMPRFFGFYTGFTLSSDQPLIPRNDGKYWGRWGFFGKVSASRQLEDLGTGQAAVYGLANNAWYINITLGFFTKLAARETKS